MRHAFRFIVPLSLPLLPPPPPSSVTGCCVTSSPKTLLPSAWIPCVCPPEREGMHTPGRHERSRRRRVNLSFFAAAHLRRKSHSSSRILCFFAREKERERSSLDSLPEDSLSSLSASASPSRPLLTLVRVLALISPSLTQSLPRKGCRSHPDSQFGGNRSFMLRFTCLNEVYAETRDLLPAKKDGERRVLQVLTYDSSSPSVVSFPCHPHDLTATLVYCTS